MFCFADFSDEHTGSVVPSQSSRISPLPPPMPPAPTLIDVQIPEMEQGMYSAYILYCTILVYLAVLNYKFSWAKIYKSLHGLCLLTLMSSK